MTGNPDPDPEPQPPEPEVPRTPPYLDRVEDPSLRRFAITRSILSEEDREANLRWLLDRKKGKSPPPGG